MSYQDYKFQFFIQILTDLHWVNWFRQRRHGFRENIYLNRIDFAKGDMASVKISWVKFIASINENNFPHSPTKS
jgi:hypothetical protein